MGHKYHNKLSLEGQDLLKKTHQKKVCYLIKMAWIVIKTG